MAPLDTFKTRRILPEYITDFSMQIKFRDFARGQLQPSVWEDRHLEILANVRKLKLVVSNDRRQTVCYLAEITG